MNLKKCPNGHYFNYDKFPYCPHCINSTYSDNLADPDGQDKIPTDNISPLTAATDPAFEHLTAGWLVCLTGINRGLSFPIYPGDNHIGRNSNMNIRLKDEPTVSRQDHAILHYNESSGTFSLIPESTSSPTSINDSSVNNKMSLNDRDLIQLGECQLLFVRLCDNNFRW